MNNRKIISVWLSIFILIGMFSLMLNKFNLNVNAQVNNDNYQSTYDLGRQLCCSTSSEGARVYLESNKAHFSNSENVMVTYYVNTEKSITNISYTQTGFNVISVGVDDEDLKRIVVEMSCVQNEEEYSML